MYICITQAHMVQKKPKSKGEIIDDANYSYLHYLRGMIHAHTHVYTTLSIS